MKSMFVALLLLTLSSTAGACTCSGGKSFVDIFKDNKPQYAAGSDLVIYGKVIGYIVNKEEVNTLPPNVHYARFVVEIIDVLKGEWKGTKIIVDGHGGLDCIRSASYFPVGSEWILAMPLQPAPQVPYCGEYALRMIDKITVETNNFEEYTREKQHIKLRDLYKKLGLTTLRSRVLN